MSSTRIVSTTKELKKALDDKVDHIVISDHKLALGVRVIKAISYKKLAMIAGGASLVAASIWNPVGWLGAAAGGAAGVGIVASAVAAAGITTGTAAVIISVSAMIAGLGLAALVMHMDYEFEMDTSASGAASQGKDAASVKGKAGFKAGLKRRVA